MQHTTTGKEISRMMYDTAVVTVAFSPEGKYVVLIGGTTTRVWIYRSIDLIAKSCSHVTRNLTRVELNGSNI